MTQLHAGRIGFGRVRKEELVGMLPPEHGGGGCFNLIADATRRLGRKVVVLDDDPTGVQTVHDVLVLTGWSVPDLCQALRRPEGCFFILTNSRAHPQAEADAMNREIARNLAEACRTTRRDMDVISRSDSTLRGHYPTETRALREVLASTLSRTYHGEIIVPAFFEGGRYTVGDVHWVEDGKWLIPAGQTEFARDPVFGYGTSNLREWVQEKTGGRTRSSDVVSISLDDVRLGGPAKVRETLTHPGAWKTVVVNSLSYADMGTFALGLLQAELEGFNFICRSAASFVKVRANISDRGLLQPHELFTAHSSCARGGLIIAGSHVKKTSDQLESLRDSNLTAMVELDVAKTLGGRDALEEELERVSSRIDAELLRGVDIAVFTSRGYVSGDSDEASIQVGRRISDALSELVRRVRTRPRFILAKGGITSSDIATDGLRVRTAVVLGQILPGVPVWRLGEETRFPGIPYIVFPGNVGSRDSLQEAVRILRS